MEMRVLWGIWVFFLFLSGGAIWGQNKELKYVSMIIFVGLSCILIFQQLLKFAESLA